MVAGPVKPLHECSSHSAPTNERNKHMMIKSKHGPTDLTSHGLMA